MCAVLVAGAVLAAGVLPEVHAQAGQARLLYLNFPRGQPAWLLPVRVFLWEGASPYRDVLEALCRGPRAGDVVGPALPRGTRVERLTVASRIASVDLQPGKPEPRGSLANLAVQAIVHTLCQFPDVDRVVVRAGGRPWLPAGPEGVAPDPRVVFAGFPDLQGDADDGAVLALTLRGVFSGYPDGMFRPQGALTRAEAIKSLVEALPGRGLPVGMARATAEIGFSDVPREHWVLPYLAEAMRRGIVPDARSHEAFSPGEALDGATLVEWLHRAAGDEAGAAIPDGSGRPWVEREMISRAEWAGVLAGLLQLGGPDLWVVSPVTQASLEGEVLVVGTARWSRGQVSVTLMDSRGRELASRSASLCSGAEGSGPGWFAEWLYFTRPLTSSAGIVEVSYQPPEDEGAAGTVLRIPVFIR